jgi:hypothetical protein
VLHERLLSLTESEGKSSSYSKPRFSTDRLLRTGWPRGAISLPSKGPLAPKYHIIGVMQLLNRSFGSVQNNPV